MAKGSVSFPRAAVTNDHRLGTVSSHNLKFRWRLDLLPGGSKGDSLLPLPSF